MLNSYHLKFLKHLRCSDVAFLVIGGQARRFRDPKHQTHDLDMWFSMRAQNKVMIDKALRSWISDHPLHSGSIDRHNELHLVENMQMTLPDVYGVMYLDLNGDARTINVRDGIDILTSISGMNSEECMSRAVNFHVADLQLPSLSDPDLEFAARVKEQADRWHGRT